MNQVDKTQLTESSQQLSAKPREVGHVVIIGGKAETSKFNPLSVARSSPLFMVELLEHAQGMTLDDDQKKAFIAVLTDLPPNATMLDFDSALKAKAAADLGMTPERYEALTPLFRALGQMQAEGVAGFFAKGMN